MPLSYLRFSTMHKYQVIIIICFDHKWKIEKNMAKIFMQFRKQKSGKNVLIHTYCVLIRYNLCSSHLGHHAAEMQIKKIMIYAMILQNEKQILVFHF